MSFFTASAKKEDIAASTGSKYINKSGVYQVNLIAAIAAAGKNGGVSVDLFVNHEDQEQVIYGNLRISNNNGDANVIGAKTFNQLLITAGIEDVADPTEGTLPIGKSGADKDVAILEDLCDIDTVVRVQQEYSVYKNNIMEKQVIRGFYRAGDNASAEEVVNGTEAGVQYANESQYFNNTTFKDGLDEETVAAWITGKRPKGTAGNSTSSGGTTAKKPSFGQKKAFGAKKD
jgi:hypothetical protein